MGMHYQRGEVRKDDGTMRMDTMPEISIGQLLSLPLGAELLVIDIGMFGMGLNVKGYEVTEEWKASLLDPAFHQECSHSMERHEVEKSLFPGSVFVLLMPENYEPDPSELLNEKFVKLGVRDGREGMPQRSASALRTKYPDEWHEDAYGAYVTAYKRGSESRKGR